MPAAAATAATSGQRSRSELPSQPAIGAGASKHTASVSVSQADAQRSSPPSTSKRALVCLAQGSARSASSTHHCAGLERGQAGSKVKHAKALKPKQGIQAYLEKE